MIAWTSRIRVQRRGRPTVCKVQANDVAMESAVQALPAVAQDLGYGEFH